MWGGGGYLFSSHAQPLLTVHYIIMGFSECHLHMHSHYQMCTILLWGFLNVTFTCIATTNCALYSWDFLSFFPFKYTATTNCALYSWDFLSFFPFKYTATTKCALYYEILLTSPSHSQPLPNVLTIFSGIFRLFPSHA